MYYILRNSNAFFVTLGVVLTNLYELIDRFVETLCYRRTLAKTFFKTSKDLDM